MRTFRYKQVDVFTSRAGMGNPVAVVFDAERLDANEMQHLACWTNLSETAFVLPATTPSADYWLRIFSPGHELPFAGHPTIGSAHAVLEAGIVRGESFVQECGAGLLPLTVQATASGQRIWVEAPPAKLFRDFAESTAEIAACLRAEVPSAPSPAAFTNGPVWLFVQLASEDAVTRLEPDMSALARFSREQAVSGIAAFALTTGAADRVHIRCFAPAGGISEDPVTGSANAALPAYFAGRGQLKVLGAEYVSSQGSELGREGRVYVRVLDEQGRAAIGGHALTVIDGELRL